MWSYASHIIHRIVCETNLLLQHTILFASNSLCLCTFRVKMTLQRRYFDTLWNITDGRANLLQVLTSLPYSGVSVLLPTKFSSLLDYFYIFVGYFFVRVAGLWPYTHGLRVLITAFVKHKCLDKLQVYMFCPCFAEKLRGFSRIHEQDYKKILRQRWKNFIYFRKIAYSKYFWRKIW